MDAPRSPADTVGAVDGPSAVAAEADWAGPATMPASSSAPTSTRASRCSGPPSGTGAASPPRRAATTSRATQSRKNAQTSHTMPTSTLTRSSKLSCWARSLAPGTEVGNGGGPAARTSSTGMPTTNASSATAAPNVSRPDRGDSSRSTSRSKRAASVVWSISLHVSLVIHGVPPAASSTPVSGVAVAPAPTANCPMPTMPSSRVEVVSSTSTSTLPSPCTCTAY